MSVCFIASGPIEWGSARMRCYWPAKYMPDSTVVKFGEKIPAGYDVYVFQKLFDRNIAEQIRAAGSKIVWDMCDPTWWFQPELVASELPLVDALTFSCNALREDFVHWGKTIKDEFPRSMMTISDRLELSHFEHRRYHIDTNPVRLIWFGLEFNRFALYGTMAVLERLVANRNNIELTIMDGAPDKIIQFTSALPVYHVRWELNKENEIIANHDIALLPPYPGAWGKVKSNNRSLTAWASGLPVCDGFDYDDILENIQYPGARQAKADSGYKITKQSYTADKSAKQWEALCASL